LTNPATPLAPAGEKPQPTSKPAPATPAEQPKPQPTTKTEKKRVKVYYIRIASLLNNDTLSPLMKEKLKKAGLKYKILNSKVVMNGEMVPVRRVVVGPFTSKAEAEKVLEKVRAEVNPQAFIWIVYERR
jgi:cell division septation protein DedD